MPRVYRHNVSKKLHKVQKRNADRLNRVSTNSLSSFQVAPIARIGAKIRYDDSAVVRDLGRRPRISVVSSFVSPRPTPAFSHLCMSRTISLNSIKPRGKRFFPSFSRRPEPLRSSWFTSDIAAGTIFYPRPGLKNLAIAWSQHAEERVYVQGRNEEGRRTEQITPTTETDPRDLRRVWLTDLDQKHPRNDLSICQPRISRNYVTLLDAWTEYRTTVILSFR